VSLQLIEGENERYAGTLVFLHGLWVGSGIWRPLALGFAHRGWRCALLDARSGAPRAAAFGAWCAAVATEIEALDPPPILIGHDAGALVALALDEAGRVRASVAVAPLLTGASTLLDRVTRLRGRLGLGLAAPPRAGHAYLHAGTEKARGTLAAALAAEPAVRPASLRRRALAPRAAAVPSLLVAQADDLVVPASLVEAAARGLGADTMTLSGSHWPMLEPNPDAWLSPVHRWLIRRLGPSLLLLRGDEDLVPE